MSRKRSCLLLLALILSACSRGVEPAPLPEDQGQLPEAQSHPCGDGVCEGPENTKNCPLDCPSAPAATSVVDSSAETHLISDGSEEGVYWVTNPTSGNQLYVRVFHPDTWNGSSLPALVLVPGGIGDSSDFTGGRKDASTLADDGFVVIIFDPDGRGFSLGEEDKNGFIQQDGLAAIIQAISGLPGVDPDQIGLISYSYGVTMASGVLARYPDLPVIFFIDWEGPANRDDTTHGCQPGVQGIGSIDYMSPCDDEAFWSQREAVTFIAQTRVPYQRLQTERDHAQDDYSHSIDMVNAAVEGGVPWVRLNDLPPNQTYTEASLPPMLPESIERDLTALMARYASELMAMP